MAVLRKSRAEARHYNGKTASGGEAPADQGEGEKDDDGGEADGAECAATAEERHAGFAVGAEQHDDQGDGGPGQAGRQAGVAANHRHEILRRLTGGNPPGDDRSDASDDDEAEQFAGQPTLDFLAGFATDKIVPRKKADGDGSPPVDRKIIGKPEPRAEIEYRVVARSEARQEQPSDHGVAKNSQKKGGKAGQLE